jgi:hypothetical protein
MTEAEWLSSTSAAAMVDCLCTQFGAARSQAGRRKLRLLACAHCRRVWEKLTEERDHEVILVSEKFADGIAFAKELKAARQRCLDRGGFARPSSRAAIATAIPQPRQAEEEAKFGVCSAVVGHGAGRGERWIADVAAQVLTVREVFGNPFRSPAIDKSWLRWSDGTVRRIVRGTYEERAFDRLPILADALLDAGCDNEELLAHLRSEGPHVRGCWALDLLLGKK